MSISYDIKTSSFYCTAYAMVKASFQEEPIKVICNAQKPFSNRFDKPLAVKRVLLLAEGIEGYGDVTVSLPPEMVRAEIGNWEGGKLKHLLALSDEDIIKQVRIHSLEIDPSAVRVAMSFLDFPDQPAMMVDTTVDYEKFNSQVEPLYQKWLNEQAPSNSP